MRHLCLDLGRKRIGVAVSDDTELIAGPVGIIGVTSREQVFREILRHIQEQEIGRLVIGLPLSMNGQEGIESGRAREFAAQLAKLTDVPIDFMDERLTSVEAERLVQDAGGSRKKRKKRPVYIDDLAAAIILQTYLDAKRSESRRQKMLDGG